MRFFHLRRLAFAASAAVSLFLLASGSAQAAPAPWATGQSRPEDLRVFLVTFGPGDEVFSWFGHTALWVEDTRLQHGRIYNYGNFTFNETMVPRFVMGRLEFWVGDASVNGTLRMYQRENRDVRLQELNLPPEKRMEMATFLANNIKRENRSYLYHHYLDNCSTRPRDVINLAVNGQLKAAMSTPARMTLRDHTRRYSAVFPPLGVMMDLGMAAPVDGPITRYDEAFLPVELEKQVDDFQYVDAEGNKVPLVARKVNYFQSSRPPVPEEAPSYVWPLGLAGLLFGALPVLLAAHGQSLRRGRRWVLGLTTSFWGFLFGVFGLVVALLWAVTDHTIAYRNLNLLLLSPVTLLAWPLGLAFAFRGKEWSARALAGVWGLHAALAVVGLLLRLTGISQQDNAEFIALFLPFNLGHAVAFALHLRAARAVSVNPSQTRPVTAPPPGGDEAHGNGSIAANR